MQAACSWEDMQASELLSEILPGEQCARDAMEMTQVLSELLGCLKRAKKPRVRRARPILEMYGFAEGDQSTPLEEFRPPMRVFQIGEASLGLATLPSPEAEVAVEMPAELLRDKDYLDHRFFAKRACYLAHMGEKLTSSGLEIGLELERGDPRKPTLLVNGLVSSDSAADGSSSRCTRARLRVLPPEGFFPEQRLELARGNARPREQSKYGERPTSPEYNHCLAEETSAAAEHRYLAASFSQAPIARSAAILLSRWAKQRGFLGMPFATTSQMWACVTANQLDRSVVRPQMGLIQALRAVLWAVANGSIREGVTIGREHGSFALHAFGRLSEYQVADIEKEAKGTYDRLAKKDAACVDAALLQDVSPPLRADLIAELEVEPEEQPLQSGDMPSWRREELELEDLAKRALRDRATSVFAEGRQLQSWPSHGCERPGKGIRVYVRFAEPATAFRMVDLGPSPDDEEESAAFKSFWGDMAGLRRFKDGTIAEAAVWECSEDERHLIPSRILAFVFRRHCQRRILSLATTAGLFDDLLPSIPRGARATHISRAHDSLASALTALTSCPLRVNSVEPLSPSLRFTYAAPIVPHPLAQEDSEAAASLHQRPSACIPALHCKATLEPSAQWPNDAQASEKTLEAIAAEAARELSERNGFYSQAGRGGKLDCFVSGFAFRVHLQPAPHNANRARESDKEGNIHTLAAHTQAVRTAVGHHTTLAQTAQLLSRWASLQLLKPHMPHEAVEAIAAAPFLQPSSATAPRSKEAGFIRALSLLGDHEWSSLALSVPLGGEPRSTSGSWDPSRARVVTGCDPESLLTGNMFDVAIANRAGKLAKICVDRHWLVIAQGEGMPTVEGAATVGRPALGDFDAIISIDARAAPPLAERVYPIAEEVSTSAERALEGWRKANEGSAMRLDRLPKEALREGLQAAREALLVGFEPLRQMAGELQRRFGRAARVFFDPESGDALAIAFIPSYFKRAGKKRRRQPLPWELAGSSPPRPEEMVQQMAWMGKGLVTSAYLLPGSLTA